MNGRIFIFAMILSGVLTLPANGADVEMWSTAVATRPSDGHKIVYRYQSQYLSSFRQADFSDRIVFHWSYAPIGGGMPSTEERQRMDRLPLAEPRRGYAEPA
ncbi:MAG: hypothetical protein V4801_39950 [Burkholderia gladioli]